jgi:tetratricopeptide (TPR) repeat protein
MARVKTIFFILLVAIGGIINYASIYGTLLRNFLAVETTARLVDRAAPLIFSEELSEQEWPYRPLVQNFIISYEDETVTQFLKSWLAFLDLANGKVPSVELANPIRYETETLDSRQRYLHTMIAYNSGDQSTVMTLTCSSPSLRNVWVGFAEQKTELTQRNEFYAIGLSCLDPETPYYLPEADEKIRVSAGLQYWAYAKSLAEEGREEEALAAHKRAIELAPKHHALLFLYARRLWLQRGTDSAGEVLDVLAQVERLPNTGQYGEWSLFLKNRVLEQINSKDTPSP